MRLTLIICLVFAHGWGYAQNIQFRSLTTYPSDMSDIWGYSDGEREYALAGYEDGFSVVDVTDPDNPVILHDVPGPNTFWRDIKTFGHYAYGVHENVGLGNQGLVIMDLSQLPDALPVSFWTTNGSPNINYRAAHNIFIDENGIIYISGHNMGSGGVLMLNAAHNPVNPSVVGMYTDEYVHDCFARNDTLWTAEVGAGRFSVINVRSKSNPVVLARQSTPFTTTHNIWVSDDGNTAVTTDEQTGAYIAAYDVSNIQDIKEVGRYRSGASVIPHNVFLKDDYAVISYYADGVVILDAAFPDELVEVGSYDTAPNFPGPGFHGAWGVYPYLPSGNILATDIEEGLYVLTPEYRRATHIRGTVINAVSRGIITGADVRITGPAGVDDQSSNLEGKFKWGFVEGGIYTIEISKTGFEARMIELELEAGSTAELEIELTPLTYTPTDTIYADILEGESLKICDDNTGGLDVDEAFVCGGLTNSGLGSWTTSIEDLAGCLTYSALPETGGNTDQVCLVEVDGESGGVNVNLVVVNIIGTPTAIQENPRDENGFSLAQNPVSGELLVINHRPYSGQVIGLQIYDSAGRQVSTRTESGSAESFQIPVSGMSRGIYILALSRDEAQAGSIKFIRR